MRTYVINLERRPDRRAHMERTLDQLCRSIRLRADDFDDIFPSDRFSVEFTTHWEGPLDGRDIDEASLRGFGLMPWKRASCHPYWCRPLRKGEVANSISHWRCWKDAQARDEPRALIFEDDAVVTDDFLDKLCDAIRRLDQEHPTWDFLYLGRQRRNLSPTPLGQDIPVADGLVRPGFSYWAQAYVLTRSGLDKLLSVGFEQQIIPIDEFIPALYTIHPRPDVARRYRPILEAFAIKPSIAFHLEGTASDVEFSDLVDWQD